MIHPVEVGQVRFIIAKDLELVGLEVDGDQAFCKTLNGDDLSGYWWASLTQIESQTMFLRPFKSEPES